MGAINEDELDWSPVERGAARFRRKQLAIPAGGDRLGCSLYEIPPGGRSWPFHYHAANEEALYVLAGTGTVRLADAERSLEPGDYVALPTGEDGAHRVVNDGSEPLRYLMVSTMHEPDVTVYPDSGTFGVFVGSAPGSPDERELAGFYPIDADVEYWSGEEGPAAGDEGERQSGRGE